MYTVRKRKLGDSEIIRDICRGCGAVWTATANFHWRIWRKQGVWMNEYDMQPLVSAETVTATPEHSDLQCFSGRSTAMGHNKTMMQAPSVCRQSTVRSFYDALKTWKRARNSGALPDGFRPPYKGKRFYKASWNYTAIKIRDGRLRLTRGRGKNPLWIDWPHDTVPVHVEIGWDGSEYELRAKYKGEEAKKLARYGSPKGAGTAGVDLGEIYLASVTDGSNSLLLSGKQLQHLRQLQNKEKEWFASRIDCKKKGSNRWWKLVHAKNKRLDDIRKRIDDVLHKLTTRLVEEVYEWGCDTIVVGDLSGIRTDMDYGRQMNQRLHQWAFRKFLERVRYKAERYGLEVVMIEEAYTSRTCPGCGPRHKPKNRGYTCPSCGLQGHRDVVGALNIRAKYQDPDGWADGHLEAVRTTATEASSTASKGTLSSDKSQLSLWDSASVPKRTTSKKRSTLPASLQCALHSPTVCHYDEHMKCVISA